jgi:hypothetical protein
VPITILNACQSGKQIGSSETSLGSRLMQVGVQLVLVCGMGIPEQVEFNAIEANSRFFFKS